MTGAFLAAFPTAAPGSETVTLTTLLWAVYAAIIVATAAMLYNKAYVGASVRAIIKRECFDKDTALTMSELGLRPTPLRRRTLRASSTLRKYISIANEDECKTAKARSSVLRAVRRFFSMDVSDIEIYDLQAARFYIPKDKKHSAEVRYGKELSPLRGALILAAAVLLGLALILALMYFIPEVLKLSEDLISYVKNALGNH